jgi:hypothetical protein
MAAVCVQAICTASAPSISSFGAAASIIAHRRGRRRFGQREGAATLQQLKLAQPALQRLAPPAQRLVDRLRRRGEAPLKDRERETNGARALVILKRLSAIEFLAHIVGHFGVEACFSVRQLFLGGLFTFFILGSSTP